MKRVLIIAYAFPPSGAVGSMRPLRFCRYLTRNSRWQPQVMTVARPPLREDPSLLAALPAQVPVHRTRSCEPYYRLHPPIVGQRAPVNPVAAAAGNRASVRPARWRGVLATARYWFEEPLQTPDPQVFWNLDLVPRGRDLVRRQSIDVILATAPPYSSLVGAAAISRLTGRPLVVDLRDPWTEIERGPYSPWRRRCERWLEARVCHRAARVISTSDLYSAGLRERYPRLPAERFVTLHNGFDEEAFAAAPATAPADRGICVVHLGSFYHKREPEAFFAGAARWLAADPSRRADFRLVFVGNLGGATASLIARHGLADVTEVTGHLPHAEAIAVCRRADLLLLAMGSGPATPRGWLPSKLFEYLACERPILAHTVDGEAAQLIRRAGAGDPITTDDPDAFAARLDAYAARKAAAGGAPAHANDPVVIDALTQRRLVQRLAAILDEAAS